MKYPKTYTSFDVADILEKLVKSDGVEIVTDDDNETSVSRLIPSDIRDVLHTRAIAAKVRAEMSLVKGEPALIKAALQAEIDRINNMSVPERNQP